VVDCFVKSTISDVPAAIVAKAIPSTIVFIISFAFHRRYEILKEDVLGLLKFYHLSCNIYSKENLVTRKTWNIQFIIAISSVGNK